MKEMNNQPIRIFEGFAGYGGASFAFKKAGIQFKTLAYSEIDKYASQIFDCNHPDIPNYGDIAKIEPDQLPDFDMFTGGFPCQPFSSAGLGLGENDIRGTLFYDIIRICRIKKPKYILLENVKGILSKRHKKTLETIIQSLKEIGYDVRYCLLNSADYGNAQRRERVWIFAYLGSLPSGFCMIPPKVYSAKRISHFLDKSPDTHLYLNKKQIERLIEIHNVDFNVTEPLCFDVYNKKIRKDGSCITITEPHHNSLRIVEPPLNGEYRVRKLSIPEHYRLMGFEDNEFVFGNFSYQQLAKRAGNGWDVALVAKLLNHIFNQI